MTENPERDREREQDPPQQDAPQAAPQDEPKPEETATASANRLPDGTWRLHLAGSREDQRQDLRGIVRAVAAALRTDGNGGESCPDQIGGTIGQWASEAIYA